MKLQFLLSILSACCLLSGLDSEEYEVIGSDVPIKAAVGEDVILPCHLEPPRDVCTLIVKWKRNGTAVHIYRSRADDPNSQDESFKDRTSLFCNEMFKGNISLKLLNVTEQDKGVYTCCVPRLHSQVRKGNVTLEVVPKGKEEEIKGDPRNNSPPASHCEIHDSCIGIAIIIAIAIAIAIGIGIGIGIGIERKCGQQQGNTNNAVNFTELARLHSD